MLVMNPASQQGFCTQAESLFYLKRDTAGTIWSLVIMRVYRATYFYDIKEMWILLTAAKDQKESLQTKWRHILLVLSVGT